MDFVTKLLKYEQTRSTFSKSCRLLNMDFTAVSCQAVERYNFRDPHYVTTI
jgi:hypothetical protein